MKTKTVYQLDDDGFLVGQTVADESPLEPGVFLIPRGCIEIAPLPLLEGKHQKFLNGAFEYVDAPPPPETPPQEPTEPAITPLQFIERFTQAEQLAIVTAAMSSAELRLWYDKLMAAQEVVFSDPRLPAGLDALVAAGLITAERKVELLTP